MEDIAGSVIGTGNALLAASLLSSETLTRDCVVPVVPLAMSGFHGRNNSSAIMLV